MKYFLQDVVKIIDSLEYFIVENEKTARAYIKKSSSQRKYSERYK